MGYETTYQIDIRTTSINDATCPTCGVVGKVSLESMVRKALDDPQNFPTSYGCSFKELCENGPIKWYEHDEDMKRLSRHFPDVVFILKGDGEDTGDQWVSYYKNGIMQNFRAKIIFPEPGTWEDDRS